MISFPQTLHLYGVDGMRSLLMTWKSHSGDSAAIGAMVFVNVFHNWFVIYNLFSTHFTFLLKVMV